MKNINRNITDFKSFINDFICETGAVSASFINLDSPKLQDIAGRFGPEKFAAYPESIRKSAELRCAPAAFRAEAESIFMFAYPFAGMPDTAGLLRTDEEWKAGLVAAYALKRDYHLYAADMMNLFRSRLLAFIGEDFFSEVCADSKPIPEKVLGEISGLGRIGFNSCLHCADSGSACAIFSLLTDIRLEDDFRMPGPPESVCAGCGRCIEACPGGALDNNGFHIDKCIACICGLKRGLLSRPESVLIGDWIFGCGLCVNACQPSRMPKPGKIDLEWLLMSSSNSIKAALAGTVLEHAGITQLRRNALAVLANKHDKRSDSLMKKFLSVQQSGFLAEFAATLS